LSSIATTQVVILLALCGATFPVHPELRFGGSVTVTSDYVYRGVSQTQGKAAVQLDLNLLPIEKWSNWSVGVWGSEVRLIPTTHTAEVDFYSQWQQPLSSNLSVTAGAVYYTFPNDPRPVPYEYLELTSELSWRDQLTLHASWAPKVTLFSLTKGRAFDQKTWTVELVSRQRLPARLDAQVGVGYFEAVSLADSSYTYGSAGLSREFGQLRAELTYIWAGNQRQRSYTPTTPGGPWAATVSWHF
jgi:uncharacterized protein (TIGR02001 family)